MSTRPRIVLPGTVGRTRLPLLALGCAHRCPDLGTFRVTAGGEPLDTTPLVARASRDHTSTVRPLLLSARRWPQPGREARWPRRGLHHAAVRARSVMMRDRSGPSRYRRRR